MTDRHQEGSGDTSSPDPSGFCGPASHPAADDGPGGDGPGDGGPGDGGLSDGHAQDGPAGGRSILARYWPLLAGGVALGMHLMVGGAYTLTLLLAPGWVSLVTALWWLVLLLVALLLLARRSPFVLAVPLVAILSWAALISAGRAWFGWA